MLKCDRCGFTLDDDGTEETRDKFINHKCPVRVTQVELDVKSLLNELGEIFFEDGSIIVDHLDDIGHNRMANRFEEMRQKINIKTQEINQRLVKEAQPDIELLEEKK